MLSLLVLLLNGCESISGTKSYCSVAEIITVSKDDVLTEQTTKELLIHNVTYDAICG